MTDQPTVLLVHGAFAGSSSWNPVIQELHGHGVTSQAVANPLRSVAGDAAYVRDVIAGIGTPIVLVGHSYGGFVVTEAAAGNDLVRGLVYVGAFAPDHGESAFQLSTMFPGSTLGDALTTYPVATGGDEMAIRRDIFAEQFAADVAPVPAALMGATQRPVTAEALTTGLPTETPAWRTLPSWFVYGESDRNIPAALSRWMAERAGAKGTREVPGASHALSVSAPGPVTETILDALSVL